MPASGEVLVPNVSSPTLRQRELGFRLRELRSKVGMTVEQVSESLLCSPSKISRLETGRRLATLRDVRDLCELYGVRDPAERERLMTLSRDARQRGWWQEYSDLGDRMDYVFIGLEAQAVHISAYNPSSVPLLLQTAEYARTLIRSMLPSINDTALEQRVEARLYRQNRLTEAEPPRLDAFMDEAALRRRVGSAEIMRAQLNKISQVAKLANVAIRIVPYEAGAHPAIDSTFNFLEFGDESIPDVVYAESLAGNIYVERKSDLIRYREALYALASVALNSEASRDRITKIGNEFEETA